MVYFCASYLMTVIVRLLISDGNGESNYVICSKYDLSFGDSLKS